MTWHNPLTGNFYVGEQPTKEVNEVVEPDLDYAVIADKPSEDYYYDGVAWVLKGVVPLTKSDMKRVGLPYTLNGITYQVPLDESGQNGVNSIAIMLVMNMFTPTSFSCSNGTKIPLANSNEATSFCMWFADERGKFFK